MKLLLALTLTITICSVRAQTVEDIIAQYLKNSGGKAAWDQLETIKMVTTMKVMQGDVKTVITQKKPNLVHMETNANGRIIIQAYDGTTAWMINPITGDSTVQLMPELLKKQLLESQQSLKPDWIYYKEKGYKLILEGKDSIDGQETYKIRLIRDENSQEIIHFYFDAQSYMPIATHLKVETGPDATITVTTRFTDYKATNLGILMPHRVETDMMGQNSVLVFESMSMNEPVDENIFKMPKN